MVMLGSWNLHLSSIFTSPSSQQCFELWKQTRPTLLQSSTSSSRWPIASKRKTNIPKLLPPKLQNWTLSQFPPTIIVSIALHIHTIPPIKIKVARGRRRRKLPKQNQPKTKTLFIPTTESIHRVVVIFRATRSLNVATFGTTFLNHWVALLQCDPRSRPIRPTPAPNQWLAVLCTLNWARVYDHVLLLAAASSQHTRFCTPRDPIEPGAYSPNFHVGLTPNPSQPTHSNTYATAVLQWNSKYHHHHLTVSNISNLKTINKIPAGRRLPQSSPRLITWEIMHYLW